MNSKRKQRDLYLRRKYNITLKEWEAKLKAQGGKCELCGSDAKKYTRALHTDHNHASGRVRGLLCMFCNKRRVGQLTVTWAKRVYEYLRKHDGEAE